MSNNQLPHQHGQLIENIPEQMPPAENFQVIADIEECVINISALVDMSSPAVSHHLRQLKASGLIVNRRVGKEVYYKAADTEQAQLLHHMIEKLAEIACISQH